MTNKEKKPTSVNKRPYGRERVLYQSSEPSLTKQEFKEQCQISVIMAKYEEKGILEHTNKYQGQYGDFSNHTDYQSSLNSIMAAQDMFEQLPSQIRSRFKNDPSEFLEFVQDPDNLEEMQDLGLANKTPPAAPTPSEPPQELAEEDNSPPFTPDPT